MTTASRFLATWFGEGNRLTLSHVDERERLRRLVDRFDDALDAPSILPRMNVESDVVTWYLLASNDDDFRRALGEVRGAVGPTYARWQHPLASVHPADPLDAAAIELTEGRVAKFVTGSRDEFEAIWPPLERLLALWLARPVRTHMLRRPVAVIVHDIDLALHAGATDAARRDVRELRARGAISAQNARFTEVRALAAEGRWSDILASPYFGDLCRVRRPWTLTEVLARAAHEVVFRTPAEHGDRDAAMAAYRAREDDLAPLLRLRGPARDIGAIQAFAVHAAVQGAGRATFGELEAAAAAPHAREWIRVLADEATTQEQLPARTAEDALFEADFRAALSIARRGTRAEDGRVAVLAAYELGTLEAAQGAMDCWTRLDADARAAATERRVVRDALAEIKTLADGRTEIASWHDWLKRVAEDPQWANASAVARSGELEFVAVDELSPETAGLMAASIQALLQSSARPVVIDALPALLGWLASQDAVPSVTTPLYVAVLEAVALTEGWESGALEVSGDVVERLIAAGLSPGRYLEVLDLVDLIWGSMASRRLASWFADLAEFLEASPGDHDRLRMTFASGVALLGDLHSIDPISIDGLRLVAGRLGLGDLLPPIAEVVEPTDTPHFDLTGKTIGIYSLTPPALVRAKERILTRYPAVDVITNGDHVATPALTDLAKSADLMIVALGSAKHAATDAISAARPTEALTVRGAFKGSTRIVEAVIAVVEDEGRL